MIVRSRQGAGRAILGERPLPSSSSNDDLGSVHAAAAAAAAGFLANRCAPLRGGKTQLSSRGVTECREAE